jgi:hypothetical protein
MGSPVDIEGGCSAQRARHRARARSLVAIAALTTACVVLAVADPKALCLLPLLALATPLLLRRYPGERALLARLQGPARMRPARASSSPRRRAPVRSLVPRGGLLLGSSLAVRPPPAIAS